MNQVNDNLARAEKLGCYCILWDKDPEHLKNKQVPEGYCGLCETCGRPGHTRHFPGAVPYTGTWCDRHYRRAMILHPLGRIGVMIYFLLFFVPFLVFFLNR